MGTDSDDSELWARAAAGDGESFGIIFDRHRARVLRHSLRLVPTTADADDVVAITFMEAWRHRRRIRFVDGSVLPWLLVTATNVSSNMRRSARRHSALLRKLPVESSVIHDLEDAGEVADALRNLSLIDRQVLTLCVLEGFSEREAADALGTQSGTIKSRLFRAKVRLRRDILTSNKQEVRNAPGI